MPTELESWERQHFTDGGGEPFLFYVVFGNVDASASLSRSKYRCDGMVDGIDIMTYGPTANPEVPSSFLEGYLWEQVQTDDPDLAKAITECEHCMVFRCAPADDSTLDYLRDTVGFITFALENGGCAVYDPFMLKWWNPSDWKNTIFEPAGAVPRNHTVILASEDDEPETTWFHTRGMRKFGRPDISVRNVTTENENAVVDLCNRLIEQQAFGHVVPDGQEIRMDALPNGGSIHHAGTLDDPDFNNVHLIVTL